jgi:hypothetical protein
MLWLHQAGADGKPHYAGGVVNAQFLRQLRPMPHRRFELDTENEAACLVLLPAAISSVSGFPDWSESHAAAAPGWLQPRHRPRLPHRRGFEQQVERYLEAVAPGLVSGWTVSGIVSYSTRAPLALTGTADAQQNRGSFCTYTFPRPHSGQLAPCSRL